MTPADAPKGATFRCGHARVAENATGGDHPRCRLCRNAYLRDYMRTWRGGWPYKGEPAKPKHDPWRENA